MLFDDSIKFYGQYRPYQLDVLNNLNRFLDNDKIHIVAAPGSGKTILGLELIKRLDKASLILVPSIAIREQWIDRFNNNFLIDKKQKNNWISNDLRIKKPIICITYQALYSAFKKTKNSELIDDISKENIDYSNFDLLNTLLEYNIQTLCLDECHHLKSEWWKVLEYLTNQLPNCKVISLTATPPYDASISEWQRYISLCGPIDDEIIVPELIKDNNLCYHHDFIYFSYPTNDEEKRILKSYANGIKIFSKYKNNPILVDIISKNKIYLNYKQFKKMLYENENYYTAMLIFLLENNIKIPFKLKLLVLHERFNIKHLEILLQHVLFEDNISYEKNSFLNSMKKEFSSLGIVHNRKVNLAHDDKINKYMSMSLSKLEAINVIVNNEYEILNSKMKCLILTDYIKLKTKNYIGNLDKEIDSFGTLPIFEYLRRNNCHNPNFKLCCLSGSICIIHKNCKNMVNEFEINKVSDDYYEILIQANNRKKIVSCITHLFEQGYFNILIGTKSLLGEGWDSPCVNTLILASLIGTYVLSNQMRGRAIRTNKNEPDKIAHVWHLVCLDPFDYHYSFDYYNLQKRFSTFIGIDINKKVIENGIERIGINKIPTNKKEVDIINQMQLNQAKDKSLIKDVWNNCLNNAKQLKTLTKITMISRKRLKKGFSFYSSLIGLCLTIISFNITYGFYHDVILAGFSKILAIVLSIITLIVFFYFLTLYLFRIFRLLNPEIKLYTFSKAIINALIKNNVITSKKTKVVVKRNSWNSSKIYLLNATTYEQNIFSECLIQMFEQIDQPRYLLAKPRRFLRNEYYVVPDVFKKNKETVKILERELAKKLGHFQILFAKNEFGKNEVIKAQQLYYLKYHNVEISTKNILLEKRRRKK